MKAGIGTIPHPQAARFSVQEVACWRPEFLSVRFQLSFLLSFPYLPLPFVPQPPFFSYLLFFFLMAHLVPPSKPTQKQLRGTQGLTKPGKQPFFLFLPETEPKRVYSIFFFLSKFLLCVCLPHFILFKPWLELIHARDSHFE